MTTPAEKGEQWMAAFESLVVERAPRFAGRINWDAATFFFNRGDTVDKAAFCFIVSEEPKDPMP
jgi:hypothetical protein